MKVAAPITVAGRTLTFPVEVRRASSWAAQFLVDADTAQEFLPSGLRIARVLGRGVLVIPVVRYEESDLDAYNEVGIAFLVRGAAGLGVHIRHLPVTQEFTLEAGRRLWGYPKFLADISITESPRVARCTLDHEGARVLSLTIRTSGLPIPARTLPTYSVIDDGLHLTSWEMSGVRARGRFGGARIELGNHPIAEELRLLGLPKRALATQVVPQMRARFGPAEAVR